MTSSPDLTHALRASRPAAPAALRMRVRELAREPEPRASTRSRFAFPFRRVALVAVPAAALLALVSAGAIGLSRSDVSTEALREQAQPESVTGEVAPAPATDPTRAQDKLDSSVGPTPGRAQRVSATLTLEVADPEAVSRAAQDALELTRRLGGHVVSASVATGDTGSATLTVRVPVAKVQQAIVELSALGRIASQQVTIDDLQEQLDALERRQRSLRSQIALITARLASEDLDPETRARLEVRRKNLRDELRNIRSGIASVGAEARMATIHVSVVTPEALGAAPPPPSRLERTLDEALNVLVWEGVVALAIAIVAAPFALLALAAWLGQRFYRRREEERLLSA
jgi:hypothetical protein